jgi:hypothetical protein
VRNALPHYTSIQNRCEGSLAGMTAATSRWSTDHKRQKVFDKKHDASLCPRKAKVINIEPEQDDPSLDVVPPT